MTSATPPAVYADLIEKIAPYVSITQLNGPS